MRYLDRAFSFRVLLGCGLVAALVGALLSLVWEPLSYGAVPVFVALWIGVVLNDDTVVRCPHCRKRVKVGASTCHRCGLDVHAA